MCVIMIFVAMFCNYLDCIGIIFLFTLQICNCNILGNTEILTCNVGGQVYKHSDYCPQLLGLGDLLADCPTPSVSKP